MDLLYGRFADVFTLDCNMAGIYHKVLAVVRRDTVELVSIIHIIKQCDKLFRDDDDGSIQIHLNVNGLVRLQSILEACPGLLAQALESLTRYILQT